MSRRALEVLALVVLALAAVVLLEPPRGPVVTRTRLVPGRPARVTLERPGAAPIHVDLAAATVDGLPADTAAVRDLAGALELLSYRRRVRSADPAARGLDAPRLTLGVDDVPLRIGARVPDLGQVWLSTGAGWDYLVDDFAVRELDRSRDDLRRHAPFSFVAADVDLVVVEHGGRVTVRGRPLCVDLDSGCARADRERVRALLDRLAELELARFIDPPPTGAPELRVTVGGETLSIFGDCGPGLRAVTSATGAGCLRADDARPILDEQTDPASWIDTHIVTLVPSEIDRIEAADVVLERRGGGWSQGGTRVSAEAVRDLLGELASHRGTPVAAPARDAPPEGALTLRLRAGPLEETLWLLPDRPAVMRRGEPLLLVVHPSVRAAFRIDPARLGDRRVLAFEPNSLLGVRAEPPLEVAERGETGESWRLREPADLPADLPTVLALRDAAAALTAREIVPDAPAFAARRLTFTTAEAPGVPAAEQTIELGAPAPDGTCLARRAAVVYRLPAKPCAALDAHLATRDVFATSVDDVIAVTVSGRRAERHGARWYGPDGALLSDARAHELLDLVAGLRRAPRVSGYGTPRGEEIVIEGGAEKVTLRVGAGTYGRADRPVIYGR